MFQSSTNLPRIWFYSFFTKKKNWRKINQEDTTRKNCLVFCSFTFTTKYQVLNKKGIYDNSTPVIVDFNLICIFTNKKKKLK